ncbi:uracil-DNA glycosylase family protein [Phycisphaera mikurensis]|uniref:Uracil-DNA glycosylase n=1 Tax=Phycisphaera mikurensis (strain NBRC 102666 / KCTC 22515 / FYK2301M01) TaxID=1142394 RepID=I0IBK0_PHYMF|nr:uracil-DNA glycosylase family protein [Phycisphaera mikurensis]MBB6442832.1 single-strand selective monofunctional uracil DNA glycosylase [Phycisphaera mikurensis]BAM02638.1 uracil-DNA glycosylase [Phycisphaera mikurensis NBRC 102666]
MTDTADALVAAALCLRERLGPLRFAEPVHAVYQPLAYAWPMMEAYLRRFGAGRKSVLLVGMNPGPWGMAQTGVPFGDVPSVRGFLGLEAPIGKPADEHPKRPVTGLGCPRTEVSGSRVWSMVRARFGTPEAFFADHFVLNFCPLVFLGATGRNLTPDKLPAAEREPLLAACDEHLAEVVRILRPAFAVGIGVWAEKRVAAAVEAAGAGSTVGRILHPSPASPLANTDWGGQATRQLEELGAW